MDILRQDLRYAVRGLARTPGFAVVACLTLALGAGVNAVVFSFVDALLLRPVAGVRDPASLVAVYTSDFSSGPYGETSYPDFVSIEEQATTLSALAAYADGDVAIVRIGDHVERLRLANVAPDYFEVLGLRAARGRLLTEADAGGDTAPAVVISHALWSRAFGSAPGAIGSTVAIDGRSYTITGVAPPRFDGLELGSRDDIWRILEPPPASPAERGSRGWSLVGRLAPGASIEEARAELSAIADRLARAYPGTNLGTLGQPDAPRPMTVVPHHRLGPQFRGEVGWIGGVMMAAAFLVLLTACANVANLLLSRASGRSREMAVRLALGATGGRLVRQLVAESLLLGAAGAAAGLLLALWTADALPSFFPPEQAGLLDARVDARVIVFSVALAGVASLLFGLVPAVQVRRPALAAALRQGPTQAGGSRRATRLRGGFVVAQVALAFVLLVSAGLLVRSLSNALDADLGFATRDAVMAYVEAPSSEMTPSEITAYYREAVARVRAVAGVDAASLVRTPPLSRASRRGFQADGYVPQPGEDMELPINAVSPGYFETLRIPVVAGRVFDGRDTASSQPVVVVNDVVASRYFGGDAVGRQWLAANDVALTIVGIVGSGPYLDVRSAPAPMVYYPIEQAVSSRMILVARTSVPAVSLADRVRDELRAAGGGVAVYRTTTLEAHLDEVLAGDRLTASLVGACGLLALALALIGVYGVVAYSVSRRTRELGVRVALGARPRHLAGLVLGEALGLTLVGTGVGAVAAFAATRLLASRLYLVSATDAPTFAAVPVALAVVGLLAAWLPARRALGVDPIRALHEE